MTTDTPLKNISAKMLAVMRSVGHVPKNGVNQFHRYRYVSEADIAKAFSQALVQHGVFLFSSVLERHCQSYQTRGGKDAFLVTVKLEVTFVDTDSGEHFSAVFYGDGSDSDDKAIYKAITGAQKYALMKTFLVATGDDVEKDDASPSEKTQTTAVANAVCHATSPINEADKEELFTMMRGKARQGTEVFRHAWRTLSTAERTLIRDRIGVYEQLAKQADNTLAVEDVPQ